MSKFKVGQLVRVIKSKHVPEMLGSVVMVLALPETEYGRYIADGSYTIDAHGFVNEIGESIFGAYESSLAPIDDTDHRTKADEDELIFNPNLKKELTDGSD